MIAEINNLNATTNIRFKTKAEIMYDITLSIITSGKYNNSDVIISEANNIYNNLLRTHIVQEEEM